MPAKLNPPTNGTRSENQPADPEISPADKAYEWLYAIVTEEAKQDPDWRAKARTGYGPIDVKPSAGSPPPSA
jgi:hypothetical protein